MFSLLTTLPGTDSGHSAELLLTLSYGEKSLIREKPLDFKKAFYCVQHSLLIRKLQSTAPNLGPSQFKLESQRAQF